MRISLLLLGLVACIGKPCPLVCTSDADCPAGDYCLNEVTCLADCVRCNGSCVDTFHNCGACGNACATGQFCSKGTCKGACDQGLTSCSGSCANLVADRSNCGACGNSCAHDQDCLSGKCVQASTCQ